MDRLTPELRDAVLQRMGLPMVPAADLEGLRSVYRAWCASVPFDNVRKMIALLTGGDAPLPGGRADDFFIHWLQHGSGGTCWPSSNGLFTLLEAIGFDAHRVAGAMRDLGIVNHASVRVNVDGTSWLADSSMLTEQPLPLGNGPYVNGHPIYPAEVERDNGSFVIWYHTPPNSSYLPCRLLVDPADHTEYLASYERSRERSPFNQRLYARRNRPGELLVLLGNTRFSRTAGGIESRDLSPEELRRALCEEIGLSPELVERWAVSGGLIASFEPPGGPKPPPVTRKPPSMR